jgi:4-hydroxybenzoate polyprenyltransferase
LNAYVRLSRLHRPTGILLLMLPCWWGVTLANPHEFNFKLLFLFALGAAVMRSAGCVFNDLIDQKIDRRVERTKTRPLATGELSKRQAFIFSIILCLGGLGVLLMLPSRCWPLATVGLLLLAIYPFMKRITHWPQVVLGFAFNLGVIFGAVAVATYETINWPATLCLYGAGIAWTMAYDTIYALQDKEDDLKIGVKSTAIKFGNHVKFALYLSYGLMFGLLSVVGYLTNAHGIYYGFMLLGAIATYIILYPLNINDSSACLKVFDTNPYIGWWVWVGLLFLSP